MFIYSRASDLVGATQLLKVLEQQIASSNWVTYFTLYKNPTKMHGASEVSKIRTKEMNSHRESECVAPAEDPPQASFSHMFHL